MTRCVVTGTDTGIGKTVFSAALTGACRLPYWKPIQSGLEEETDSEIVARLADVPIRPEAYRLATPASPHFAAEVDGRSEEHTSALQSLMRISYAVFCLKKKKTTKRHN